MDLGRPPLARFPTGDVKLSDEVITHADLEDAINKVLSDLGFITNGRPADAFHDVFLYSRS
jgi:stage III sporulation protein SpoIIIAA